LIDTKQKKHLLLKISQLTFKL